MASDKFNGAGGGGGAGGCCETAEAEAGDGSPTIIRRSSRAEPPVVSGGTSGTAGSFGHGGLSPDVAGKTGVVTTTKAPNTQITSASISSANHRATFRFKAIGIASGFQCELKRGNLSARFKNCSSPKTYLNLKVGRYVFNVRAVGPGGTDLTPATMRFSIT